MNGGLVVSVGMKRAGEFNQVHSLISDSSSDSDSESDSKGKECDGSGKKTDKKPKNLPVKYSVPEGSVLLLVALILSLFALLKNLASTICCIVCLPIL